MRRFSKRVAFFAPEAGVMVTGIKVKDTGYRWASCGKTGTLSLHWKCKMAPSKICDHIVVHELCHFHHRNHTDAFWNEGGKVMPDFQERKECLRNHGTGLDIYA